MKHIVTFTLVAAAAVIVCLIALSRRNGQR